MVQIPFSSLLSDPETDDQFQIGIDPTCLIGPPEGIYRFEDYYCPDPNCDCKRVTLVVVDQDLQEHAVITYGWMPRSFYFQSVDDNEVIEFDEDLPELTLGYLEPLDDQTENSPFFLDCFLNYFRDDPLFREWLERRYRLFKEAVSAQSTKTAAVVPFPKK